LSLVFLFASFFFPHREQTVERRRRKKMENRKASQKAKGAVVLYKHALESIFAYLRLSV